MNVKGAHIGFLLLRLQQQARQAKSLGRMRSGPPGKTDGVPGQILIGRFIGGADDVEPAQHPR